MIAAIISITTFAIGAYLGFRLGRADGMKRAAFEEAFRKGQGK